MLHSTLLTVENLRKSFGGVDAVRSVSFDVRPGQLVALIGSNGAGKTTTFNCINGQLKSDGGRVLYDPLALNTEQRIELEKAGAIPRAQTEALSIAKLSPRRLARLGIARTFQITATFASMTVIENVQMVLLSSSRQWKLLWGRANELNRSEAMGFLEMVGLHALAEHHAATLAYGDLKRLELAMALALNPKLLLMDEPTAGMGVEERDALMRLTQDLARARNIGVLFTEHDMDAVFNYADWVIVMHRGEIIARGLPKNIRADANVQSLYLGEKGEH